MPDLETGKTEHESNHAPRPSGGGDGAADPPSAMEGWWKTPSSLTGPPAVDPAVYGIDASDTGGSLDAYIGMSGAASAQVGSGPSRATLMQQSDGERAHALSAQLLLAAKRIQALVDQIDTTMTSDPGERGHQAIVEQLERLVGEADKERGKIILVTEQKFPDPEVQKAALHVSRASYDLRNAVERVKKYARDHHAVVDEKQLVAYDHVDHDVVHLESTLPKQGSTAIATVGRVTESEAALRNESLEQSFDGLQHSIEALLLAVREPTPAAAVKSVLPGLLSNLAVLDASLVDVHPTPAMRRRGKEIVANMETAYRVATPQLQSDGGMQRANDRVPKTIDKLESLAKGKKK